MSNDNESRPAGWVHHPRLPVMGPLDMSLDLPVPAGPASATLHLVYTADGLYVPAVSRRPAGPGPHPVIIALHGGSGGLGIPYLVDHVVSQGWALEAMLARGYAVVFAEGRMEHEDAYGADIPFELDHKDVIAVFRFIAKQPWADPARIGFFGVSHGGELQMKLAAELGTIATTNPDTPMPAALSLCEPAIIEFLGLKYEGVRKESNLQFNEPIPDSAIDIGRATARIAAIPDSLPILVVGRNEDHLQGPFLKLHELLGRAGKNTSWASFSYPEHAYQFGPRRGIDGYAPDPVQQATLDHVLTFLDRNVRDISQS
jgi:acetyl esterase/lipase